MLTVSYSNVCIYFRPVLENCAHHTSSRSEVSDFLPTHMGAASTMLLSNLNSWDPYPRYRFHLPACDRSSALHEVAYPQTTEIEHLPFKQLSENMNIIASFAAKTSLHKTGGTFAYFCSNVKLTFIWDVLWLGKVRVIPPNSSWTVQRGPSWSTVTASAAGRAAQGDWKAAWRTSTVLAIGLARANPYETRRESQGWCWEWWIVWNHSTIPSLWTSIFVGQTTLMMEVLTNLDIVHMCRNDQSLKNWWFLYGCLQEHTRHREKSWKIQQKLRPIDALWPIHTYHGCHLRLREQLHKQHMKNQPGKLVQQAAQSCLGSPTAGNTQINRGFNHRLTIKNEDSEKNAAKNISTFVNPNISKSFHGLMCLKPHAKPAPHMDTQLATIWGTYAKGQMRQLEGLKTWRSELQVGP